eukprot:NODE_802_length_4111_cov_0.316301.p3 type:complete len:246 gc:universal NODE_802_length_4111_cov_0.316301:123-860(+)
MSACSQSRKTFLMSYLHQLQVKRICSNSHSQFNFKDLYMDDPLQMCQSITNILNNSKKHERILNCLYYIHAMMTSDTKLLHIPESGSTDEIAFESTPFKILNSYLSSSMMDSFIQPYITYLKTRSTTNFTLIHGIHHPLVDLCKQFISLAALNYSQLNVTSCFNLLILDIQYIYPIIGHHYIRLVQGFAYLNREAMRQAYNTLVEIQDSINAMQQMMALARQLSHTSVELSKIPNILDKLQKLLD